MGAEKIHDGVISDTDYIIKATTLEKQHIYVNEDDSDENNTPFTIICDKGSHISTSAIMLGGQVVTQPAFGKGDKKFSDKEPLRIAAIAHDWSGNERVVRYMKLSGFIKAGLQPNESTVCLANVWLCWGFQAILYKQTHLKKTQSGAIPKDKCIYHNSLSQKILFVISV
jgi:hypothetical protein